MQLRSCEIISSRDRICKTALLHGSAGLAEDDFKSLSAVMNKDTSSEALYRVQGTRVSLGGYRSTPISVRSNPLRIFPYPLEVPVCMQRFFQWRDKAHHGKSLHALILACQALSYLLHIYPIPDGNGRTCRLFMQDYMIRQGYLPVVM